MTVTPSTTPEFQSFFELLPFTGDVRQNVVHWLKTFNEVCATADFHDDQRRLWLPLKLRGGPKSWYRLEQQTLVNYNWKEVQMAFIEAFGTSSQIEQASRSLRTHIASHETENSVAEFRSDKVATTTNKTQNASPPKGALNKTSKARRESLSTRSPNDEGSEVKTSEHEHENEEDVDHAQHQNVHLVAELASNVADTASNIVEEITNVFATNNDEKHKDDKNKNS
ncbi:unnamed protein product, partial [Didymodactylos carnosus]